jgi:hypothetical protein
VAGAHRLGQRVRPAAEQGRSPRPVLVLTLLHWAERPRSRARHVQIRAL